MTVALHFDPGRELAELRGYAGPDFDPLMVLRWEQVVDEELEIERDEQRLYRVSEAYPYNLTAFAMTATKLPYLQQLTAVIPPPARILDYGCGIGSDGLMLLEAGYEIAFADFDNPSTRYLRWRLRERGHDARFYDLDREAPPAGFDAAYSFDVLEHVADPHDFLDHLERLAGVVCVNILESGPEESALHAELPVNELLARVAHRQLLRYRRPHPHSHLVIYRTSSGSLLQLAKARAAISMGRRGRRTWRRPEALQRELEAIGDGLHREASKSTTRR